MANILLFLLQISSVGMTVSILIVTVSFFVKVYMVGSF